MITSNTAFEIKIIMIIISTIKPGGLGVMVWDQTTWMTFRK